MKITVGIDLHNNNALCGLVDESGRRLVHQKLPCNPAAILELIAPYQKRIAAIAVEFTGNNILTNCRQYPKDEAPVAYKDFDAVLGSVKTAGLAREVARLQARFVVKDADTSLRGAA